jgi:hypothetical protein
MPKPPPPAVLVDIVHTVPPVLVGVAVVGQSSPHARGGYYIVS